MKMWNLLCLYYVYSMMMCVFLLCCCIRCVGCCLIFVVLVLICNLFMWIFGVCRWGGCCVGVMWLMLNMCCMSWLGLCNFMCIVGLVGFDDGVEIVVFCWMVGVWWIVWSVVWF